MGSILDYLKWRGDLSFNSDPFNHIDALILSQLSYLNFDGLLLQQDFSVQLTLLEAAQKFRNSWDFSTRSYTGALINKLTLELLFAAAESERFGSLLVTGYCSRLDLQNEEQFAAETFIFPDNSNFVAFRGTDDNLIGWKEDFNLALYDEVPAQKDSAAYLEKAMLCLPGKFITGGHSKGGNLAVYSACTIKPEFKNRIHLIYNLDGPGFTEKRLSSVQFIEMKDKIHSFYPQFSIVGMLFNHIGNFAVVESEEDGLMQHDPFSWHVEGRSFVERESLDEGSEIIHKTFNQWMNQLSHAQLELLIETYFEVIQATKAKTSSELEQNPVQNILRILEKLGSIDKKVYKALLEIVVPLFSIMQKNLPTVKDFFESNDFVKSTAKNIEDLKARITQNFEK